MDLYEIEIKKKNYMIGGLDHMLVKTIYIYRYIYYTKAQFNLMKIGIWLGTMCHDFGKKEKKSMG